MTIMFSWIEGSGSHDLFATSVYDEYLLVKGHSVRMIVVVIVIFMRHLLYSDKFCHFCCKFRESELKYSCACRLFK